MYPRNNASPERLAIGQVVLIADGTVQTSGVSIVVRPQAGAESAGGGTTAYGADGTVYYTPTQAETNYTSFVVIAYKASCFSASQTVITTASSTAGSVVLSGETHTGAVIPTVSTLTGHTAQTGDSFARLGVAGAGLTNLGGSGNNWNVGKTGYTLTATTGLGNQTANITGNLSGSVGSVTGAVGSVTGAVGSVTGNVGGIAGTINTLDALDTAQDTQHSTTQSAVAIAQGDLDIITDTDGVILGAAGVDLIWDEALSGHTSLGSVGRALQISGVILSETTATGTPTTTTLPLTAGSSVDNFYNDMLIIPLSGSLAGQARPIASYIGSTKTITVDEPWTSALSSGDSVIIKATHIRPISEIQSGLATSAAQTTAQNDLDLLTGADGATLATSQPNYAPNTVVPDPAGTAPTAVEIRTEIDTNSTQLAAIVGDTNELQTNQGNWLTATGFATEAKQDAQDLIITEARLAELDAANLPAGVDNLRATFQRNTAISNIEFLMIDSVDDISPKTGLTVTGQRSIDGGAFAAVSGTISEVGSGIYQFDALAADTNGGVITYKFSSTGANDTFITMHTTA